MAQYSIREIEYLSGVRAHTIRIWEQRYDLFQPQRTDTNIRCYNDHDLKLILNIALLNKHGYKIGHIARMKEHEISQCIQSLDDTDCPKSEIQINALAVAMIDLDEERFEKIISTAILQIGLENTMIQLIYPFLEKVGIMWMTGCINPAQEHFISNLIRQKIIVAIDGQTYKPQAHSKQFLLFLPESEMHEISLLFLAYMLKARQHRVIYLGMSVPLPHVLETIQIRCPDYAYTILTSTLSKICLKEYIQKLADKLPNGKVIVSGQRVNDLSKTLPNNVITLKNICEIREFINNVSA
jgi:DNA-binding transcriptional MerR regulator